MHSLFLSYLLLWKPLGYTLTFLGMVVEGDAMLFTVAFLTSSGFFDTGDMLAIASIGVFVGDILWYFLGKKYIPKYPKIKHWVDRFAKPVDRHLMDRPFRTILLTKFIYGVHHAVLMRAGMFEMDFRKFIKTDLLAIAVWFPFIWSLGFFGSVSLIYMRKSLRFAEVSLLVALLLFFLIEHLVKKSVEKSLMEKNKD